jgi:hypothetical protein
MPIVARVYAVSQETEATRQPSMMLPVGMMGRREEKRGWTRPPKTDSTCQVTAWQGSRGAAYWLKPAGSNTLLWLLSCVGLQVPRSEEVGRDTCTDGQNQAMGGGHHTIARCLKPEGTKL